MQTIDTAHARAVNVAAREEAEKVLAGTKCQIRSCGEPAVEITIDRRSGRRVAIKGMCAKHRLPRPLTTSEGRLKLDELELEVR